MLLVWDGSYCVCFMLESWSAFCGKRPRIVEHPWQSVLANIQQHSIKVAGLMIPLWLGCVKFEIISVLKTEGKKTFEDVGAPYKIYMD